MKKQSTTLFAAMLLGSVISLAQTQYPGGVSGGGSNQLWLDANQLSLSHNDYVSTWNDASGNGNDATSVNSARPRFKTNKFNGLPALEFDGVNDRLRTGAIAALNTNKQTSFAVFSSSATNSGIVYRNAYSTGAGTASQFMYGVYAKPSTSTLNYLVKNSNKSDILHTVSSYTGTLGISSQKWNSTTALVSKLNGTTVGTTAGSNATPGGLLAVTLGANYQGNTYLKMFMAEQISYSTALSSAEVNIVENYLAAKYNITISNDMYAHQATYGHDLIGLGKESDGSNLNAKGISPLGMSIATLSNSEYIFAGHNNAGYNGNTSDVPAGFSRYNQIWQADVTGAPGTITVTYDVSTYALGDPNNYILLVDPVDNIFITGATQYVGTYLAGTVTFTNVTMPDNAYFTLSNGSSEILSTGITTDWHTATTWNCTCIPTSGNIVTVQAGHTVDINGQNANSAKLTIDGTLTFSGSDTLQVSSDFTNNNTVNSGNGTLYLNGLLSQNLVGTTTLNNVIVDNSVGVVNTGSLGIKGWLNVVNGSISTGNDLTLISNASGTAGVYYPETGTISGTVTVQRYLNEGESWYLLAPAVTDGNLEDWNQEFEMQGFTGTDWLGGSPSVQYYDQNFNNTSFYDGYRTPNNTATTIDVKVGWNAYVGDDSYATGARTIDMTGTLALGYYPYTCKHIVKVGDPAEDGWSLITNPYAAPVLWGNVDKTGLFDEAQYKKTDGSYGVMDNSFVLASGEAFWVHYNPGVGGYIKFRTDDINTSALVDNYNNRMAVPLSQVDPLMEITLNDISANYNDYCYIGFSDDATNDKDPQIDAYKLAQDNRNLPNLASIMQGKNLLKNVMNSNTNEIVPLRIYTNNPSNSLKNYTLSFSNVRNVLNFNKSLILEDRVLNTFTELLDDIKIDFTMSDDNNDPRFFLHVSTPILFALEQATCTSKSTGKASATINGAGNYNFIWKNEDGNIIKTTTNAASSSVDLVAGNYILEVNNFKQKFTVLEPKEVKADFVASYGGLNYGAQVSTSDEEILFVNAGELITFESHAINHESNTWDFGDRSTSDLENTSHIYFEEGEYKVALTSRNGNCSSTNYKLINVTKANTISASNLLDEVNVYNVKNDIFIQMNNQSNIGDVKFEVLNALGQVIYSTTKTLNNNHMETIRIDEANGLYLINVEGFGYSKTKKIVLN